MWRNSENVMVILLQLQVTVFIVSAVLIEINGQRNNGACFHNGTHYYEQSFIPSIEPCLSCRCLQSNLICSLKVCPDLPVPPPRGCVVSKKPMSCCSYLSCSRKKIHIPKKRLISYLDRFDKESIDRIINSNINHRRSDDADDPTDEICIKNGTVYKSGSAMMSSGICTYCYCIGGQRKCVKPKCILPIYEFGCKPIFVDSTCCPVRYDCNTKSIGKSNLLEGNYKRTTNKHYERMFQRLERNRGCTVDDKYYSEGQKMLQESNKPCDICFCIRGRRKCAPKKCSPSLRNCIPIVPKGQCCPSSYECGNQKELNRFQRSHQSRQFDLFSLIFGDDDDKHQNSQNYPSTIIEKVTETSKEKGFFDSIRYGLKFIDRNGNNVENILDKSVSTSSTLSNSSIDDSLEKGNVTEKFSATTVISINEDDEDDDEDISWFDILLGKDRNETVLKNGTHDLRNKIELNTIPNIIYNTNTSLPSVENKKKSSSLINMAQYTNMSYSSETPYTSPKASTSLIEHTTKMFNNITTSTTLKPTKSQIKPVKLTEIKASEKNIYEIIDKRTRPAQLERVTTTTSIPLPIVDHTNPSILESDFVMDYVDPTLPPSLPNLDIIQFMPGDAVKTTRYPAITERNVVLDPELPNYQDYTADYEDYQPEPSQHTGFSPPTKTEGGFVPKDPIPKYSLNDMKKGFMHCAFANQPTK
ncbi:hypothetical protein ACFFRR_005381 [Megaselia abdita]